MSVFLFPDDNLSEYQCIFAVLLWRSSLGLLMGKVSSIFELSARDMPVFSFPNNNLSKC